MDVLWLPEPPIPPSLPGGVADLWHYSETLWGCECCPRLAYVESCRAACPGEVVEIPHANPQIALGLFSASCLRSVEQGLGSRPESLAKSLLLFHLQNVWGLGSPADTCELSADKVNGKHRVPGGSWEMVPWPCELGSCCGGVPGCPRLCSAGERIRSNGWGGQPWKWDVGGENPWAWGTKAKAWSLPALGCAGFTWLRKAARSWGGRGLSTYTYALSWQLIICCCCCFCRLFLRCWCTFVLI